MGDEGWLVFHRDRYTICVPGAVTDGSGRVRLCWANRDTGVVVCYDGEPSDVARLPAEGLSPKPEGPGAVTMQVPPVGSYAENPHKPRGEE